MIKITGKYEEQLTSALTSYMERNQIKTKSEAVLKMVITFEKQADEVLKLHNANLKLESENENLKSVLAHLKESILLINKI